MILLSQQREVKINAGSFKRVDLNASEVARPAR